MSINANNMSVNAKKIDAKQKDPTLRFASVSQLEPASQLASSPQFVTVLPGGREVSMDDPEGCREAALRIEMLSRGLIRPAAYSDPAAFDAQEAAA